LQVLISIIVFAVILPAGLAAAGGLVARWLRPASAGRAEATAVGLTAGLIASHLGSAGIPPWPPTDTLGWVPFVTLAALLLMTPFERGTPRLAPIAWVILLGLGATAAYLLGRPTWSQSSPGTVALALGSMAVWTTLSTFALEAASRRLPPWSVLLSLAATAGGCAAASVFSHTALVGLLFGGVAAALGGLALTGLVLKSVPPARAALAIVTLTLAVLLLYVRLYAYPPLGLGPLVLLGLSFFVPLAASLLPERSRSRPFAAIALAAVMAALAALLAHDPRLGDGAP
jgi:hypothetical protein